MTEASSDGLVLIRVEARRRGLSVAMLRNLLNRAAMPEYRLGHKTLCCRPSDVDAAIEAAARTAKGFGPRGSYVTP